MPTPEEIRPASAARYGVERRFDVRIPMRDGVELSANLWLPEALAAGSSPDERWPSVLELIPYGKDNWRFNADESRMTYLAKRGFAGCRVDVRGTGSSGGIALDEYTTDETADGVELVGWLAAQPWSNGNVGMWGISYGGFTAIQVAAEAPAALKAIVPMYATDDRYADDVHYVGGCVTVSELAQYAVSQVAMNAMPPRPAYWARDTVERGMADWRERWHDRLEETPPWLFRWLREQHDGPYWRLGSLAPDYGRIRAAILHIAGWMDGYSNPALRMQAACVNAPRRTVIGNWSHSWPDSAYPGPNLDWLHEAVRWFDRWLKGIENGVMDEPGLVWFRREFTQPEAFPAAFNGTWTAEPGYPIERAEPGSFHLATDGRLSAVGEPGDGIDRYPHRPTLGTAAGLTWGAGGEPTGLARDLRPDEALSLTYTSEPLSGPLDILGFAEAVLHLSVEAPVATVVARIADVAPDGTSALVTTGVLNLTHRDSHAAPAPLEPGRVYEVRVPFKAAGYRFLPGQRIRLTLASGYWPVLWPSPLPGDTSIHRGGATPSRLALPVIPALPDDAPGAVVPIFKTTRPALIEVGSGEDGPATWQIAEDVLAGSVTVTVGEAGTTVHPDGLTSLFSSEHLAMTAYHRDPARASLVNDVVYHLRQDGHEVRIDAGGQTTSTATDFRMTVEIAVDLDGERFFERAWEETIPRRLV